jgi:prepilin-type N-terminal cleavage/methylation domain-containing protein
MNSRRGFTLIELMMVIAILGVLLSVAARSNTRALERARDAALMTQLQHLRTAVYQYSLDHQGTFPADLAALSPRYLPRIPTVWKGSRDEGCWALEPQSGAVYLLSRSGDERPRTPDSRGIAYADY